MHKAIYITLCLLALQAGNCWSHPPSSIGVQYDKDNNTLMLDVKHLSRDNIGHYIQRIDVQKNQDPPRSYTYRQQVHPNFLNVDLDMAIEVGDELTIHAYSRQGGVKELIWEATEDELKKDITPRQKRSRAISTHPRNSKKLKSAVPKDSKISRPTRPSDPNKNRPAFSRDPSIAKPAIPKDRSKLRPAVTTDPNIARPTHPKDPSKLKPAVPRNNSYSN